MRWYGKDDPIPLNYIKQIPVISGVVSAIYDIRLEKSGHRENLKIKRRDRKKQFRI